MNHKNKKILKWGLFSGLIIIIILALVSKYSPFFHFPPYDAKPEQTYSTKKQQWQEMEKKVDSWGDASGRPIDPGIKDTVIVLNLLGFKTSLSCEGHLDRGWRSPWIHFDTTDLDELYDERQNIIEQIHEKEPELQKGDPVIYLEEALAESLEALYSEKDRIDDKIEILSKTKLIGLKNLIDDFYKKHLTDPDKMITIHHPILYSLYSIGGDWQIVRSENEKKRKLAEYQQEMKKFTNFLKDYYFSKYVIKNNSLQALTDE